MINKYAEITDRILLYNACKGILRVKTADDKIHLDKRYLAQVGLGAGAGGVAGYTGANWLNDALGIQSGNGLGGYLASANKWVGTLGGALLGGYGGHLYNKNIDPVFNHDVVKAAALHKLAVDTAVPDVTNPPANSNRFSFSGTGAVGGAAGAAAGYAGTGWLNNKLGLTADRGGWRKWLGRGIRTAGTLAGAGAGYYFGSGTGQGWQQNAQANAAAMQPPQK